MDVTPISNNVIVLLDMICILFRRDETLYRDDVKKDLHEGLSFSSD